MNTAAIPVIVSPLIFAAIFYSQAPLKTWRAYEKQVRDGKIERKQAEKLFPKLIKDIKGLFAQKAPQRAKHGPWRFPLAGYGPKDMGEDGFKPHCYYGSSPIKGYNFFDGNRHGGHPAYDIFINDRDLDTLADHNQKPVFVIAPVDLLILSINTAWEKGSGIRGGNYIWAYSGNENKLFYFAHLKSVKVESGDFCPAGVVLATLGRSGKNAWPERCPTHLHMMVLDVKHEKPLPYDYWKDLK